MPSLLTHLHFNWGVMVCKEQTKYQRPAGRSWRGRGEQSKSGRLLQGAVETSGGLQGYTALRVTRELQKIHQTRAKRQCWNPGSGSRLTQIGTRHFVPALRWHFTRSSLIPRSRTRLSTTALTRHCITQFCQQIHTRLDFQPQSYKASVTLQTTTSLDCGLYCLYSLLNTQS